LGGAEATGNLTVNVARPLSSVAADQAGYNRAKLSGINRLWHKHLVSGFECSHSIFNSYVAG